MTRARIEEVHDVGLYIHGGTSFLTAQELTVSGIDAALCIEDGRCPVSTSALGVATASGATVTLDSFEITEADLCGIFVGDGGTMNLSNGVVSRSTIGACVLDASTPLESLSVGVRYVDNDVNLDATTLPEPSVGDFRPSE